MAEQESTQIYTSYALAQKVQRDYVCASCWGHLVVDTQGEHDYKVTCPQCGDDRGFNGKIFAERRQAESMAELIEAKRNLAGIIPGLDSGSKSEADIVKSLGF